MPVNYGSQVEVVKTVAFNRWLQEIRDPVARSRIHACIRRLEFGHAGDVKFVGDGVLECRIHHGPGYRVYFARRGPLLIVLLCGGDKSTQRADIERVKALLRRLEA